MKSYLKLMRFVVTCRLLLGVIVWDFFVWFRLVGKNVLAPHRLTVPPERQIGWLCETKKTMYAVIGVACKSTTILQCCRLLLLMLLLLLLLYSAATRWCGLVGRRPSHSCWYTVRKSTPAARRAPRSASGHARSAWGGPESHAVTLTCPGELAACE